MTVIDYGFVKNSYNFDVSLSLSLSMKKFVFMFNKFLLEMKNWKKNYKWKNSFLFLLLNISWELILFLTLNCFQDFE